MLSGEGNEKGEKTAIGLISKKSNFARAAHFFRTFLCRCFARLQHDTSGNFLVTLFLEEISYLFLFTFFITARSFSPSLPRAFLILITTATKFSCCSSNKKCLLFFFISRSRPLSPFFSLSFADLPSTSSVFLFLYIPNLWT